MSSGRFISFEGGEGVGKSTQAAMLVHFLQERGLQVVHTREPGGTHGAEAVRALLLDSDIDWHPRAEALLFAAARADHTFSKIAPALGRGHWVVCDRYLDSSRAYQGGGEGVSDDEILALHQIGSHGLLPDLTILLAGDEENIAARIISRDGDESDRIGGRDASYHRGVAKRFNTIATGEPERFIVVQADGSADNVHRRVVHALAPLLGEGG